MKISWMCALGAMAVVAGAARADLKWTETMSMGAEEEGAGFSVLTTHYMNSGAGRTDTKTEMGPISMTSREVDLCPTKMSLSFLDDAKLYCEAPLGDGASMMSMPAMPMGGVIGGVMGRMGGPPKPKQTGTEKISYKVRDMGTEKILGMDTHHFAVDTSMTATGCAGNGTTKTSMEIWKANIPMPAPCLATTFDGTIKSSMAIDDSCDVKTTFVTDAKVARDAFDGFIMRLKFGTGKAVMTREVTMLSRAPVEASVFAIPAGYRKVTRAEFDKARQAAMMKAMTGDDAAPETPATPDNQ